MKHYRKSVLQRAAPLCSQKRAAESAKEKWICHFEASFLEVGRGVSPQDNAGLVCVSSVPRTVNAEHKAGGWRAGSAVQSTDFFPGDPSSILSTPMSAHRDL